MHGSASLGLLSLGGVPQCVYPWLSGESMHGICMVYACSSGFFLTPAFIIYQLPLWPVVASCHIYFVVPDLEGHGPWSYLVFLSLELFFSLGGTVTH